MPIKTKSQSLVALQNQILTDFFRARSPHLEGSTLFCSTPLSVRQLALKMDCSINKLLKLGRSWDANLNLESRLSLTQIRQFCDRLKLKLDTTSPPTTTALLDKLIASTKVDTKLLKPRAPIVTILGHVDHGKTTLLEQIRRISVRSKEHGGITQHLGIYQVPISKTKMITFMDTPGHEVFTKMRSFGAQATDIAVLVIAADDGIKPQTIEAIKHIQAARTPVIIFINKMDRPSANSDLVLEQLPTFNLIPEALGGKTIVIQGSALKGQGIKDLLDAISLLGEILELTFNPHTFASGLVLDTYRDPQRGSLVALLIQNGTLKKHDLIVVGSQVNKIKIMRNSPNQIINQAIAGTVVKVPGVSPLPVAGNRFIVVFDARWASQLAFAQQADLIKTNPAPQADVFAQFQTNFSQPKPTFNLIVKADTSNTLIATLNLISQLKLVNLQLKVIHQSVGTVSENDFNLALAGQAWIISFNTKISSGFKKLNQTGQIKVIVSQVIYEIGQFLQKFDIQMGREKMQTKLGHLTVLKTFPHSQFGLIAGCRVDSGEIKVNSKVKLMRQQTLIAESIVLSLKHLKDDIKLALKNQECGVIMKGVQDIQVGDEIIVVK